jgi:hypothetical protein
MGTFKEKIQNMKIAILLFGQPRFLDMTINLIKEEFDLPDHDVDYFFHFWDRVGYMPHGVEANYNTNELNEKIHNTLNVKNGIIQDYTELDERLKCIINYREFYTRKLPISCEIKNLRYTFGQHWSIRKGFESIRKHEEGNNFKYDIVIKARTDIVYKPKESYKFPEEYYKDKNRFYTHINLNRPSIKCPALRIIDVTEKRIDNSKPEFHQTLLMFYKNQFRFSKNWDGTIDDRHTIMPDKPNIGEECGWMKYVENYNLRLAFNDWSLVSNRAGAEIMYWNWFENYFITLSKDIMNNKTTGFFITQSEHSIQGQFLLNYDLAAERISPRRDVRVLHPQHIKDGVTTSGKILAMSEEHIRYELRILTKNR